MKRLEANVVEFESIALSHSEKTLLGKNDKDFITAV
jgi:hypothetical protein